MIDDAGDPGPQKDAIAASDQRVTPGRVGAIALMIALALLGVGITYIVIALNPQSTFGLNEVIVLIAGFVTVTLVLYLGTLILRSLDLGSPTEALGMPQGSIRALIAMSLILIFAIVGFVVLKSGSGDPGVSHGITQAQIDALRADGTKITSQTLIDVPAGQPTAAPGTEHYDVATLQPLTDDAHDFALQLLSTVSTLVVAVAGFYFGAQSVSQASKTVQEQQALLRRPAITAAGSDMIATEPEEVTDTTEPEVDDGPDEPEVAEADSVDDMTSEVPAPDEANMPTGEAPTGEAPTTKGSGLGQPIDEADDLGAGFEEGDQRDRPNG
ncbi:MAG: hypothetical protein H0V73_05270 [Chloroflexi bacterium]|nr:hypothetical protein [Chloroflexota bacterium]